MGARLNEFMRALVMKQSGGGNTKHRIVWYQSPVLRAALAALVAFTFYAAWGAWANREYGTGSMVLAGLTQGAYSAVVTLAMTSVIEWLFAGDGTIRRRQTRCVGVTVAALVVSSVLVHLIAGTAEVILTVLPSWVFGTAYTIAYAQGLARAERRAER
ncbi:MAG: hypothetical protein AAFQ62_12900 [Pseudomonadota bacterium]